jgi:spore germination protein
MNITKKRIIYTLVVTLIVVFSGTFSILMTLERNDYRNYLQGEYSKNMYDLITGVQNIRVNLGKAAIVGSNEQKIAVFGEIFRQSSLANIQLNSLPLTAEASTTASKFLSQVGDFCYSLSTKSSQGQNLTDEDYNKIESLKDQSFSLENELNNVSEDVNQGAIKWGEIRKKISGLYKGAGEEALAQKFSSIQKQIAQYPALIYDGPFSDNTVEKTPKIESAAKVSEKDAESVVKNIIGADRVQKIELQGSDGKTSISAYSYAVTIKGRDKNAPKVICEISKNGGKVIYLLDGRNIGKPTIDPSKSIDVGGSFLDKIGYKSMISTYMLNYENACTINYVYKQGDTVIYPDQIKLKIALDDGSIVGIESEKYLVSHEDTRKLPVVKLNEAEARKKVGNHLEISSVRLAVIPTETNEEVLCYEFSGAFKEDNFKVYINTQNGYEQRILQIMNTPNGQLTM